MIELPCKHCGLFVALNDDWGVLEQIPWCQEAYPKLWAELPQNFTREDYVQGHAKQRPHDFNAQDNLLISLHLAPRCSCNQCGRR